MMRPITISTLYLPGLEDDDATRVFGQEILGPMLELGMLEHPRDWDVVEVLSRVYQADVRRLRHHLAHLEREAVSTRVTDLAATVSVRLTQAPRPVSGEERPPIDTHDLRAVFEWHTSLAMGWHRDERRFRWKGLSERALRLLPPSRRPRHLQLSTAVQDLRVAVVRYRTHLARPHVSRRQILVARPAVVPANAISPLDELVVEPVDEVVEVIPLQPLPVAVRGRPQAVEAEVRPAQDARLRARVRADLCAHLVPSVTRRHPWTAHAVSDGPSVLIVPELPDGHEVWFVGDVHGDLLGLEAVLAEIEDSARDDHTVVFLGDLIDDGFHDLEVCHRVLSLLDLAPDHYLLLAGNHDEALAYDAEHDCFSSAVTPAQTVARLQQELCQRGRAADSARAIGRAYIAAVAQAPRAVFLPGGLLAAHAGFPHRDLWEGLHSAEDLASPACLGDFAWNRLAHATRKRPNRSSRQSQFGAADFQDFREVAWRLTGRPLEAFVRGHDHVPGTGPRFDRPGDLRRASFEERVLTLNTTSFNARRELSSLSPSGPRAPATARWRAGEDILPVPVVVEVPHDTVAWYSNPCGRCGRPNALGAERCDAPVQGPDGVAAPCAEPLALRARSALA